MNPLAYEKEEGEEAEESFPQKSLYGDEASSGWMR
jgi:hypothetical protein